MAIKNISGFFNYNETQQHLLNSWIGKLQQIFTSYGFVPFIPRPAEPKSILEKTGGISHEVYQINRMNGGQATDLALPYDRTVPMALWINTFHTKTVFPFKRFDIGISWRAERAQAGRYRAFFQADVDIIGPNLTTEADAECISTLYEGLKGLGFQDFTMQLNHIEVSKSMMRKIGIVQEEGLKKALRLVDKLDKLERQEIEKEFQLAFPEIQMSEISRLMGQFQFKGSLQEFCEQVGTFEGVEALKDIFQHLEELGVASDRFTFCPGMVRGLDYYTGVVFETFLSGDNKKFGSIASGGRYENLVSNLGIGKSYPGVGGSIGLTRLFGIYLELNPVSASTRNLRRSPADCVVIYENQSVKKKAIEIAHILRQKGYNVDFLAQGSQTKLKKKIEYVDKKGIPYGVLVLEDKIGIKPMDHRKQQNLSLQEVERVEGVLKQLIDDAVLIKQLEEVKI